MSDVSASRTGDGRTQPLAPGRVALVGAGPGDPDLLTIKAARLIAEADVIFADRLVGKGILELASASAETSDKLELQQRAQERAAQVLAARAAKGR